MGVEDEILDNICEDNMSKSEYDNIKMIAKKLDRDYMPRPDHIEQSSHEDSRIVRVR